jgi:hypothetical protein
MSVARLLLLLMVLTVIYSAGLSVLASHGRAAPPEASALLWGIEFQTLLAAWVWMDRRQRMLSLPFEFDAFVFFGWPLFLPYYLYRTRGKQGLAFSVAVCALYVCPAVISAIVATIVRLSIL